MTTSLIIIASVSVNWGLIVWSKKKKRYNVLAVSTVIAVVLLVLAALNLFFILKKLTS